MALTAGVPHKTNEMAVHQDPWNNGVSGGDLHGLRVAQEDRSGGLGC